jgi:hypothetical protein
MGARTIEMLNAKTDWLSPEEFSDGSFERAVIQATPDQRMTRDHLADIQSVCIGRLDAAVEPFLMRAIRPRLAFEIECALGDELRQLDREARIGGGIRAKVEFHMAQCAITFIASSTDVCRWLHAQTADAVARGAEMRKHWDELDAKRLAERAAYYAAAPSHVPVPLELLEQLIAAAQTAEHDPDDKGRHAAVAARNIIKRALAAHG